MKFKMTYDLPLRIFHWSFGFLFIVAFLITQFIEDDSPVFAYHMMAGMLLGYLVFLRVLWGIWGTKYSKFSSFPLSPKLLIQYLGSAHKKGSKPWIGHNPASSWVGIGMFAAVGALVTTGLLMVSGSNKFLFEDVHELLAFGLVGLLVAHIGGLFLHSLVHRDGLALSMIHGKKVQFDENFVDIPTKNLWGFFLLGTLGVIGWFLHLNFNPIKGQLDLLGYPLQLIETETEEGQQGVSEGVSEGDPQSLDEGNETDHD